MKIKLALALRKSLVFAMRLVERFRYLFLKLRIQILKESIPYMLSFSNINRVHSDKLPPQPHHFWHSNMTVWHL